MKLLSREQIIAMVKEITDCENHTEEEVDNLIAALENGVIDPEITNYIYWDELTPEEIADKALSYKPICL